MLGLVEDVAPRAAQYERQQHDVDAVQLERGAHEVEDVTTHLLQGEWTRTEVEGIVLVLMTSGRDSVAYLISTAMVALLTHADQPAALRDDPERIAGAIEEFLRVGAMFLTLFPRTALVDLELGGIPIPAGTTVAVSPVAANRDERRFDDPDRFDVTREAFGHLGFGHGAHACIGQQLARLEIREAVTQLLAAAPRLRLVRAEQQQPMPFAHPVATYEAGAVEVAWR
ncbi:cytochrome P450 [Microbacterium jejuense]|uniref:cytochrome P450 n=1 Tax=Microbacterium jejuense TaxID=1263637 RepID=UPI0031EAA7E7